MNLFKRLIVSVYLIIVSIISIFLIILPLDFISIYDIENVYENNYFISSIGVLVLIVSIIGLFSGIFSKNRNYVTVSNDHGDIKITNKTLVGLINIVTANVRGISNSSTKVKLKNNQVVIFIKGSVGENINIPETGKLLQDKVKNYIEIHTGLTVKSIKIDIQNVLAPKKVIN